MMDLTQERAHLALADRHVDEEERRIAAQTLIVARTSACGQDTSLAVGMLRMLEDRLMQARGHREAVLRRLAQVAP
jgi:hypothetical protein